MKLHELEQARVKQQQSDRHFYFDESGNILYYGRAESDEYLESHHAVLSYDQCKIIEENKNIKGVELNNGENSNPQQKCYP